MFSARALGFGVLVAFGAAGACYSGGNGSRPPLDGLNFPVGLAVSKGGGVLYVANADFDLQYNGGTIQSYDLNRLRRDVIDMIRGTYVDCAALGSWRDIDKPIGNFDGAGCLPLIHGQPTGCPNDPSDSQADDAGVRVPLGQTCSPPVQASHYVKKGAIIGAFATGVFLAPDGTRIFVPVRGNASLTWADVAPDDPALGPTAESFDFKCGQRSDQRCDALHAAGNNPPLEPNNTRQVTMPGEPFALAFSSDGTGALVTHQTDTRVSLFSTGLGTTIRDNPSLQFVLEGVPTGGIGATAIPHATCKAPDCPPLVRPSFLMTSRAVAQVSLLRYYSDIGAEGAPSSQLRPFLLQEQVIGLNAAAGGTDSRGVVINPTPRMKCVANVPPSGGTRTQADVDEDVATCQRLPARVFITNRSPPSLVVGEIGNLRSDGSYDPDFVTLYGNIPLVTGPSNVYLAPIVDRNGRYAVRLFVVCYDAQAVLVLDPDTRALESVIRTGPGPFAMAFDPYDLEAVARGDVVPQDARWPDVNLKKFRFGYIASFLQSFIQVVDLDGSLADKSTFQTVVYNLGAPTVPKGS